MEYKRMLKEAIETDGLQFCLDCLQEEAAELIVAINHLRRKRVDTRKVIEEMANVSLMLDMCKVGINDEIGFQNEINSKSKKIGESIKWKRQSLSKP
jgi:NTP pyrophosphatase (non-canonical NTP hydrolase)